MTHGANRRKPQRRLAGALYYAGMLLALLVLPSARARAHDDERPAALRDVAFEQKLDQQLPLQLSFRDSGGASVRLGDLFRGKPVVLNFVYYQCRDLCPLLVDGMVRALRGMSFNVGDEFDVITISFDPDDIPAAAAAAKAKYTERYYRAGVAGGWHFLTGDLASIHELADSAGFRYSYDSKTREFAHATGIVIVTPQGKTSRYYYGIEFSPRDLRLGLIEAAAGKIGSPIDQLLLFCYHYDPVTGQYTLLVAQVMRLAGGATVLALAGFIAVMLRRERHPDNELKGSR